jgi:hypothetical protein
MINAVEKKELVFPDNYVGIFTRDEIDSLEGGLSLTFDVRRVSYNPSGRHEKAAKAIDEFYGYHSQRWSRATVIGTLKLSKGLDTCHLSGNLKVGSVLGSGVEPVKNLTRSNLRPWMDGVGSIFYLEIESVTPEVMNLRGVDYREPVDAISIYTTTDSLKHDSWSIHCLRKSRL